MVVTFARKFKIDHQPIGDATRISVQLGHHVGIFGSDLKEKEMRDILAAHAFVINDFLLFL